MTKNNHEKLPGKKSADYRYFSARLAGQEDSFLSELDIKKLQTSHNAAVADLLAPGLVPVIDAPPPYPGGIYLIVV